MTERSSTSYNIRRAGRADLAVVQQISADAYTPAYMAALGYIPKPAEEDYGPRIDRGEVWILNSDGRDVGIAVLAEQRQGHGRALLEFADQRAIAIGVMEIRLYTNVRMTGNIALYRRHGYVAAGTRPHPSRAGEALVDMMRRVGPSAITEGGRSADDGQ